MGHVRVEASEAVGWRNGEAVVRSGVGAWQRRGARQGETCQDRFRLMEKMESKGKRGGGQEGRSGAGKRCGCGRVGVHRGKAF
ncbi:hypothetical protein E2C01_097026 [Portunus trituberculatus]|uniref:Uncharacterized protein n=1 Tax=Portunus trituberculatus TaxID=210409 RepID=A0A5B7K4L0_PORTR|nr:hypothetical protein [Portunus trituberculatus]